MNCSWALYQRQAVDLKRTVCMLLQLNHGPAMKCHCTVLLD